MNAESAPMDNELFYEPEDGFWGGADKLMFEATNLEAEWPEPSNVFTRKMATTERAMVGIQNLALADFKQVIGALVAADPHASYRFLIIPLKRNGQNLSLRLINKSTGELPPLRADNACALGIAVKWMANRVSNFEISCAAGGTFWVHKQ